MVDTPWGPLPLAEAELPKRRGKFVDVETFGLKATKAEIITGSLETLDITGTLTMGTNGTIRTASSGQRIVLANSTSNVIYFYSGDADETVTGSISQGTSGTGDTRTLQFGTFTPQIEQTTASQVDATGAFVVRSGSPDGTSSAPGFVFSKVTSASGGGQDLVFNIQNAIPFLTDGDVTLSAGDLVMSAGDLHFAAGGIIGFGSSYDDQIVQSADSVLDIKLAGTTVFQFYGAGGATQLRSQNGFHFVDAGPTTSASAADAVWTSIGGGAYRLDQSTSAMKYKEMVTPADHLANIKLYPTKFRNRRTKQWSYGFIADGIADQDGLLAQFDVDGEIQNYDTRGVLAVLAAKINRLEKAVEGSV